LDAASPAIRSIAGAQAPEAGLKIVGIADGETIRRAGAGATQAPQLRLEARGGQDELIWLVNGRQIGRVGANRPLMQKFPDAGRYQITVMDDSGRYDRVEISVRWRPASLATRRPQPGQRAE
jgi:penicillin-binding protein 1C